MDEKQPPMPPLVAAAVSNVMADVPKLARGEKNNHGNYKFASIDDFLEAVRPLCARHGLIIVQDEEKFELRDGFLMVKFRFTLAHRDGETWAHRPTRSIIVHAKQGAQAYGAAQSYALKQFKRSLFQIATGEKGEDADTHAKADLSSYGTGEAQASGDAPPSAVSVPETGPAPKDSRDPRWLGPATKTQLKQNLTALMRGIDAATTLDELDTVEHKFRRDIKQVAHDMPSWWNGKGQPAEFVPVKAKLKQQRSILESNEGGIPSHEL